MRCLNTNELVTNKVATIYKTQKFLQVKDLYNLWASKFLYKYANSQPLASVINCFKIIADVHLYDIKQIKAQTIWFTKSTFKLTRWNAKDQWNRNWEKNSFRSKKQSVWHFFQRNKRYVILVTEQPFRCKHYSTSSLVLNKLNIHRSIKQTENTIYNHDNNNLNNDQRPNAQDLVRAWNQRPDWRANGLRHIAKGKHEMTQVISKFPQSPPVKF